MCRFAAYLGPYIRLDEFLLEPVHNLLQQALKPQESQAKSYTDGFGIGWYTANGVPAVYMNPLPIWSDANLPHLAQSIYARLWLATVHKTPAPFTKDNNRPCYDDRLLFLYQGFLEDFSRLRRILRDFLEPRLEAQIRSNTDSEHLFTLLRHLLNDDPELTIEQALFALFDLLTTWVGEGRSLLNVVATNGECLYAARHAMNTDCSPVYYNVDDDAFPEAQLVASEPLTDSEFWQPVPEYHLLILSPHKPPELFAL